MPSRKNRNRKNRPFGTMKETRLFTCKAPPRVFEFFEAHTFNPDGKRISRGALLEQMVEIVESCLEERSQEDGKTA